MNIINPHSVHDQVREGYGRIAHENESSSCSSSNGGGCCGPVSIEPGKLAQAIDTTRCREPNVALAIFND